MTYRVAITDAAMADVGKFLDYLEFEKKVPLTAQRWWRKALKRVDSLSNFPHRCPKAPEDDLRDYTIRAMVVDSHLFLYRVDDEQREVEVFGFRHGAMEPREGRIPEE